jgi:hypothetical protein
VSRRADVPVRSGPLVTTPTSSLRSEARRRAADGDVGTPRQKKETGLTSGLFANMNLRLRVVPVTEMVEFGSVRLCRWWNQELSEWIPRHH